jgi:hypothetical protein
MFTRSISTTEATPTPTSAVDRIRSKSRGLVDAVVLARALAAVLREGAAPETLDRYAELRRPAAAKVLALASRLTRVATLHSPLGRRLRNAVLRLLDRMPAVKRRLALQLSGIARRDLSVLPLALLSPMPAGLPAGRKENFYD